MSLKYFIFVGMLIAYTAHTIMFPCCFQKKSKPKFFTQKETSQNIASYATDTSTNLVLQRPSDLRKPNGFDSSKKQPVKPLKPLTMYYLENLFTEIPFNGAHQAFEDLRNAQCLQAEVVCFAKDYFEKLGSIKSFSNENFLDIAEGNGIYWSRAAENKIDILGIWKGDFDLSTIANFPEKLTDICVILRDLEFTYARKHSVMQKKDRHLS